jgi:rhamnosyltransferase
MLNIKKIPKASVIIRTKDEEDWIGHCLESVFSQTYENTEVIIVDNNSTDKTLEIVSKFPVDNVVYIEKYLPGLAINKGIEKANGEIIVILSSHCVPKNKKWLANLINNFSSESVAGVYGRQLPVSYSSPYDVRDLFITFGLDKRVQIKDYFFHNANSAILKSVWLQFPFDENTTNIEDRIWGKKVTDAGYQLIYEPEAEVYHHHGIHHSQNISRAKSTTEILKKVEPLNQEVLLPESLKPGKRDIIALVPVKYKMEPIENFHPVQKIVEELLAVENIKKVYLISAKNDLNFYIPKNNVVFLERPNVLNEDHVSLGDVLKWGLEQVNQQGHFPDYVIYINPDYVFRPHNLLNRLIEDVCYKGLDSVFVGYTEFTNYWNYDQDKDDYIALGEGLRPRSKKHPLYKSLFGLGCITRSRFIRNADIVSKERVGIIATADIKHTLRISDNSMLPVIKSIIKNKVKD